MSWVAVGIGAASLINGSMQADKSRTAAENAQKNALAQYAGIDVPSVNDQSLALQNFQSAGQMTPEMQQAIALGDTSLAGVSTDPRLRAAQMQALAQISGIASGNPQAGDLAGFDLAKQNAAAEMNAQNNKVLQDMQQRGQAGSGAELLAKLKNNQVGTQTLATQELQQAQAMQQARLAALSQQANMSSNIRSQDYSQDAALANARDQIAKYNAANSQNVSNTNVGAKNLAQASNLSNAQNIANANTTTANDQQKYNKNLLQTQFQNQIQKAGGQAAQLNNQANTQTQNAANTANMWAQFGQGAAKAYTAANANSSKPEDQVVKDEP